MSAAGESGLCFASHRLVSTVLGDYISSMCGRVIQSSGRWLGEESDPRDLMWPFPADLVRMWPISTRVNKPENDDPSIVEPIELATDAA
jgi:hypothetical protein